MTRACFYTGQAIRGGACDDCTCTDGGTGEAFPRTLEDELADAGRQVDALMAGILDRGTYQPPPIVDLPAPVDLGRPHDCPITLDTLIDALHNVMVTRVMPPLEIVHPDEYEQTCRRYGLTPDPRVADTIKDRP